MVTVGNSLGLSLSVMRAVERREVCSPLMASQRLPRCLVNSNCGHSLSLNFRISVIPISDRRQVHCVWGNDPLPHFLLFPLLLRALPVCSVQFRSLGSLAPLLFDTALRACASKVLFLQAHRSAWLCGVFLPGADTASGLFHADQAMVLELTFRIHLKPILRATMLHAISGRDCRGGTRINAGLTELSAIQRSPILSYLPLTLFRERKFPCV